MQKAYNRINWEDFPSNKTALEADKLNRMDNALDEIDNRVVDFSTTKFNTQEAYGLTKDVQLDSISGELIITKYNGDIQRHNTVLNQLAVNFSFDPTTQKITIHEIDGDEKTVDLSAFITQYEFLDSDTIGFDTQADGKVTAQVLNGSIQEQHLRPDYLADMRVETAKTEANRDASATLAKLSESYAVGTGGAREGEAVDNAKYYSEQAQASAGTAENYLTRTEQAGTNAVAAINNALAMAAPNFSYNTDTGHLMYDGGRFEFNVDANGHMMWQIAV